VAVLNPTGFTWANLYPATDELGKPFLDTNPSTLSISHLTLAANEITQNTVVAGVDRDGNVTIKLNAYNAQVLIDVFGYFGYTPSSTVFKQWTGDMLLGRSGQADWRTYLQFDPWQFTRGDIVSARLNLKINYCAGSATPYNGTIEAYQLYEPYYFGVASWPGPNYYDRNPKFGTIASPGGTVSIDMTDFAKSWKINPATNFGILIHRGWTNAYCKASYAGSTFDVTYNETPAVPVPTPLPVPFTGTSLPWNTVFGPGAWLDSWNDQYRLLMGSDGTARLYAKADLTKVLGQIGAGNNQGAYFKILNTGNLVLIGTTPQTVGQMLWQSHPFRTGPVNTFYNLQLLDNSFLQLQAINDGSGLFTNPFWDYQLIGTPTVAASPTPVLLNGQLFADEALTDLKIPGLSKCVFDLTSGWVLGDGSSKICTHIYPKLSPGGYKLANQLDETKCVGQLNGTLGWVECSIAATWSDLDPVGGRSLYPNYTTGTFPLSYLDSTGQRQCLSRSDDGSGAAVSIQSCGSVSPLQLWTDPEEVYEITVSSYSGQADYQSTIDTTHAYDYSPSIVNGRMFWCSGIGTDALISADLNDHISKRVKITSPFAFTFPGEHPLVKYASGERAGQPVHYLACDPSAVRTSTGYTVYFSRGVENIGTTRQGAWNEIWVINANNDGSFIKSSLRKVLTEVEVGGGRDLLARFRAHSAVWLRPAFSFQRWRANDNVVSV
jgi:hypothetical protein